MRRCVLSRMLHRSSLPQSSCEDKRSPRRDDSFNPGTGNQRRPPLCHLQIAKQQNNDQPTPNGEECLSTALAEALVYRFIYCPARIPSHKFSTWPPPALNASQQPSYAGGRVTFHAEILHRSVQVFSDASPENRLAANWKNPKQTCNVEMLPLWLNG